MAGPWASQLPLPQARLQLAQLEELPPQAGHGSEASAWRT